MQLVKLNGTLDDINEKVKELEEKMNMIVRTISIREYSSDDWVYPKYEAILEVRKKEEVVSFLRYLKMDI